MIPKWRSRGEGEDTTTATLIPHFHNVAAVDTLDTLRLSTNTTTTTSNNSKSNNSNGQKFFCSLLMLSIVVAFCVVTNASGDLMLSLKQTQTKNNDIASSNTTSTTTTSSSSSDHDEHLQYRHHHPIFDDFDYTNPIACGNYKCYIPSKQSSDLGYVILEKRGVLPRLTYAYNYSLYLQHTYNITNVNLEPPFRIAFGGDDGGGRDWNAIRIINSQIYKLTRPDTTAPQFCSKKQSQNQTTQKQQQQGLPDKENGSKEMEEEDCSTIPLNIQKVRQINESAFFVKCTGPPQENRTLSRWSEEYVSYIDKVIMNNNRNKGDVVDNDDDVVKNVVVDRYLQKFQNSMDKLFDLMDNEPEFVADIQFYVDLDGDFIHIDYDRFLVGKKRIEGNRTSYLEFVDQAKTSCYGVLNQMKHDIINRTTTTAATTTNNINKLGKI